MTNEIADGVLATTTDVRLAAGFWLPARATVLACGEGRLAILSPLPFGEEASATLSKFGKVAWVVAPNRLHYLHILKASVRWPEAAVLVADGVEKKVTLPPTTRSLAGASFGSDIETITVVGAPALSETVFLHKPSKTLVVTDLVFNVRVWRGLLTPLVLTMVGARGRFAQSRAVRMMVKDRAALAESFQNILGLDFDRIVMAHGEVLEKGGKDALAQALGWARRSQLVVSS